MTSEDFGKTPVESLEEMMKHISAPEPQAPTVANSMVSILYDISDFTECILSAVLKSEKAVGAMRDKSASTDFAKLAAELQSCNPHVIIILSNQWDAQLFAEIKKVSHAAIIVLCQTIVESSDPAVLNVDAQFFMKIAPCRGEISAYSIFKLILAPQLHAKGHLSEKEYVDAQYFIRALRASTRTTVESREFILSIVNNWHLVMEVDNLITYGRFLADIGPRIAKKRIDKHSVIIGLDKYQICVVEAPDFDTVIADTAQSQFPIIITYSLSADTTQVSLRCFVDSAAKIETKTILELITSRVLLDTEKEIAICSATDFFKVVRTSILQPHKDDNAKIKNMLAEGEKVLASIDPEAGKK